MSIPSTVRHHYATLLAVLLCLLAIPSVARGAETSGGDRPPNVIMIMSDDQGWGDVGFNGNTEIKTPHLDAMAANGIKFDRFHAASPICSPSRGSCLTGRYPYRFGVLAAHTGGMRVGEITTAEALKDQGYRTGFFGKWHLGWVKADEVGSRGFYSPPWHHGYDESFATTSAVPTWDPTVTPDGWNSWGQKENTPWKEGTPYVLNGENVTENLDGDDSRIIMDRVIPFIEADPETPFYATIWFHAPHEPVVAGPKYLAMYEQFDEAKQNYYGCITAMDEQIGRLRDKLREMGIEKNTVVFFNSDNGPARPQVKLGAASAGPFKGTKHTMYEGGLLVPACAEWPGVIPAGQVTEERCGTIDFFPTVANIAGYSFSKKLERPIDGQDLMPIMKDGAKSKKRDMFFGYERLFQNTDGRALIHGDMKLLREATQKARVRLYNLADDPYETTDLAESEPSTVEDLNARMDAIRESAKLSRDGADYRY